MDKEKLFYLECLKDGKKKHWSIHKKMKNHFSLNASIVRDNLLSEGLIKQCGFAIRNDGKKDYFYELTNQKFSYKESVKHDSDKWDDGSLKSKGNAFDWKNYAKGIFSIVELAAQENGRKFGVSTASKQILPRVKI